MALFTAIGAAVGAIGSFIGAAGTFIGGLGAVGSFLLKTAVGVGLNLLAQAIAGNRVVYFHRNELRRFCIEELRKANGQPVTARELAEKVIRAEGKDPRDRKLGNDMVKRVGKSLKLLREQGVAESRGRAGNLAWFCRGSP